MGRAANQKSKKSFPNRGRSGNQKATSSGLYRETEKAVKKAQKEPLNNFDLLACLHRVSNFIGIFPCDQLEKLRIVSYPVFVITNIDTSNEPGSHWLCLRIDKFRVEIFDSLGFNPSLWNSYPKPLFDFLASYAHSHRLYISPVLQAPNTFDCGLFCIYFLFYRRFLSFRNCCSKFSTDYSVNSSKLRQLLLKFRK